MILLKTVWILHGDRYFPDSVETWYEIPFSYSQPPSASNTQQLNNYKTSMIYIINYIRFYTIMLNNK